MVKRTEISKLSVFGFHWFRTKTGEQIILHHCASKKTANLESKY